MNKQLIDVKLIMVYFYRWMNVLRSTILEFLSSLHVDGARRGRAEKEKGSLVRESVFI